MSEKKPVVINLFGAPGAGKSTGAAYLFAKLKILGINAELITEFAKTKVWEKNDSALSNQAYIFAKQYYAMTRCQDKIDVIITDGPLLNSVYYNTDELLGAEFGTIVRRIFGSYRNMNILVRRVKKYNPNGRVQSEQRSNEMAEEIQSWLSSEDSIGRLIEIDGCEAGYDCLIKNEILPLLKRLGILTDGSEPVPKGRAVQIGDTVKYEYNKSVDMPMRVGEVTFFSAGNMIEVFDEHLGDLWVPREDILEVFDKELGQWVKAW